MTHHSKLQELIDLFQRTLWLPDPGIVYVVLATVAANLLGSPPVWLLVVGPPSSGKTECLDALSELKLCLDVSTFSEAGLLSGSAVRDGTGTGGLLMQLSNPGILVASDFGTLLNEHGSTRNRLFACLREVFDGKFIRRLGTNGGQEFGWWGHAGLIGACTEVIDAPSIDLGVLGERFIYYRLPETTPSDDFMASIVADETTGHVGEIREQRAALAAEIITDLKLPEEFQSISEADRERLVTLATIGAKCRSSVLREGYSREIDLVPGHERSPRLFRQLRHLHAGLSVIGAPADESWRLVAKVALDGMHPGRRKVIEHLIAEPGDHATNAIAGHCRLPVTPTRRHLQDLNAHGVIDLVGEFPERWTASAWLRENWWAVTDTKPMAAP
jgi:hypothetical protein